MGWWWRHIRHRRGYGVHSPYLYRLVREALMLRTLVGSRHDLYDALIDASVGHREAVRLQNLLTPSGLERWRINPSAEEPIAESTLVVMTTPTDKAAEVAERMNSNKLSTLCVIVGRRPSKNRLAQRLVAQHGGTSAETGTLLLLIHNPALPKQHVIL